MVLKKSTWFREPISEHEIRNNITLLAAVVSFKSKMIKTFFISLETWRNISNQHVTKAFQIAWIHATWNQITWLMKMRQNDQLAIFHNNFINPQRCIFGILNVSLIKSLPFWGNGILKSHIWIVDCSSVNPSSVMFHYWESTPQLHDFSSLTCTYILYHKQYNILKTEFTIRKRQITLKKVINVTSYFKIQNSTVSYVNIFDVNI